MDSFKSFIGNMPPARLSQNGSDFLWHLMAGTHDAPEGALSVHEAATRNLLDTTKKKPSAHSIDVLNHPYVNQNDPVKHAPHVEMHKRLQARGEAIGAEVGGAHKHIAKGFAAYSERLSDKSYDPRKDKPRLKEARATHDSMNKEVGYGGRSSWLVGNAKTEKNHSYGDFAAGVNLSPAAMAGVPNHSSCPQSVHNCRTSCLAHTTGQNAMLSNINSKIAKHQMFIKHPEHSAHMIHSELLDHIDGVAKHNEGKPKSEHAIASFRPNMVSDYDHPKLMGKMIEHATEYAKSKGVNLQVRDYTKDSSRLYRPKPSNYFLALSHTGSNHSESNDREVGHALNNGHTVAAVVRGEATHFYDHSNGRLYPMADGDKEDQIERRHSEVGHITRADGTGVHPTTHKPTGVVSVLRVKGSSNAAKEAAGSFENQTTEINHPEHGKMKVVEINKPKKD